MTTIPLVCVQLPWEESISSPTYAQKSQSLRVAAEIQEEVTFKDQTPLG